MGKETLSLTTPSPTDLPHECLQLPQYYYTQHPYLLTHKQEITGLNNEINLTVPFNSWWLPPRSTTFSAHRHPG